MSSTQKRYSLEFMRSMLGLVWGSVATRGYEKQTPLAWKNDGVLLLSKSAMVSLDTSLHLLTSSLTRLSSVRRDCQAFDSSSFLAVGEGQGDGGVRFQGDAIAINRS